MREVALCFGKFNNIAVHPCYLGTSQQFNQIYSPHRLEYQGNMKEKFFFSPQNLQYMLAYSTPRWNLALICSNINSSKYYKRNLWSEVISAVDLTSTLCVFQRLFFRLTPVCPYWLSMPWHWLDKMRFGLVSSEMNLVRMPWDCTVTSSKAH